VGFRQPDVGAIVKIKALGEDGVTTCRLLDASPEGFVLSVTRSTAQLPSRGADLFARWATSPEEPYVEQLGRVVDIRPGHPVVLVVELGGTAVRIERRQYVRIPLSGTVVLHFAPTADDALDMLGGSANATMALTDLSEGGLFCVGELRCPTQPGKAVNAKFWLEDQAIEVGAYVNRAQLDANGRTRVALTFVDVPSRVADNIRAHLFAVQRHRLATTPSF
jgi:hypothetical protein